MRKAVVLGTGGQCRVVLSLLASVKTHQVHAIVELGESRNGETIMGKPVTPSSNIADYCGLTDVDFFIAIGDVTLRKTWWEKLTEDGLSTPNLISPSALIDETVILGKGNVICARSFIGPFAQVGSNNLINTGAIVEHEARIGDHCHLAPASLVAGRSRISNRCFIGAGSTIIDSITISEGTTVGAGSVVISSIDRVSSIVFGVPARERKVVSDFCVNGWTPSADGG
jgi:sugar O-acyltransferase (sialic acid O-acetyltransferase NeuD family)